MRASAAALDFAGYVSNTARYPRIAAYLSPRALLWNSPTSNCAACCIHTGAWIVCRRDRHDSITSSRPRGVPVRASRSSASSTNGDAG